MSLNKRTATEGSVWTEVDAVPGSSRHIRVRLDIANRLQVDGKC